MSYHGDNILHVKHSSQCTGVDAACATISAITTMTFKCLQCTLLVIATATMQESTFTQSILLVHSSQMNRVVIRCQIDTASPWALTMSRKSLMTHATFVNYFKSTLSYIWWPQMSFFSKHIISEYGYHGDDLHVHVHIMYK